MESECVACRSNSSGRPRNFFGFLFAHKRIAHVPDVLIDTYAVSCSLPLALWSGRKKNRFFRNTIPIYTARKQSPAIFVWFKIWIWAIFNWKACRHTFQPIAINGRWSEERNTRSDYCRRELIQQDRENWLGSCWSATNKSTDYYVPTTEIENFILLYISFVYLFFFHRKHSLRWVPWKNASVISNASAIERVVDRGTYYVA